MPTIICQVCGEPFHRKPSEATAARFCSYRCGGKHATSAGGHLKPIAKGERRSAATEFRPGVRPVNHQPVGTVRIRQRKNRTDAPRAWVKVAEPNMWRLRALLVYEAANGPVPKGLVVHHLNDDSLDDRPENLAALTRAEHALAHEVTLTAARHAIPSMSKIDV